MLSSSSQTFHKQHEWTEDIWFSFHPEPPASLLGRLSGQILVFSALPNANIPALFFFKHQANLWFSQAPIHWSSGFPRSVLSPSCPPVIQCISFDPEWKGIRNSWHLISKLVFAVSFCKVETQELFQMLNMQTIVKYQSVASPAHRQPLNSALGCHLFSLKC